MESLGRVIIGNDLGLGFFSMNLVILLTYKVFWQGFIYSIVCTITNSGKLTDYFQLVMVAGEYKIVTSRLEVG